MAWYVLIPVGSLLLLALFGVGIACSAGFREVLMGLGDDDKGKLSLLDFCTIEGASAIVFALALIAGGIVYPLRMIPSLQDASDLDAAHRERDDALRELERAQEDILRLEAELSRSNSLDRWNIRGRLLLPADWRQAMVEVDSEITNYFESAERAQAFWKQGTWTVSPVERLPIVGNVDPAPGNPEQGIVDIEVLVPKDTDLKDWIREIKWESGAFDIQASFPLKLDDESVDDYPYDVNGVHSILYSPQEVKRMYGAVAMR